LFALSNLFSLYVILSNPLTFETGPENYYRLARIYGAASLPFFFRGLRGDSSDHTAGQETSAIFISSIWQALHWGACS
jgi:hypothetical protein